MTRRYTQKNKSGVRGKSTLLTGLDKMRKIRKASGTDQRISSQSDLEKSLNNMAKWLVAVTKCPPRHYGKVWVEEKEVIVRQCQAMYEEMQKFVTYQTQSFMGNNTNLTGPNDRFIPLSRLRYNIASAKWDFTNSMVSENNQYWNKDVKPGPVRQLTDLVQIRDALGKHDEDVAAKYVTPGQKVTQTYAEWRLASGLI